MNIKLNFLNILSLCLVVNAQEFENRRKFTDRRELNAAVYDYCGCITSTSSDECDDTYGIKKWDVSEMTSMHKVFAYHEMTVCNPDISRWDVSKVKNFSFMFGEEKIFNPDIREWDVSSGTNFDGMFDGAESFNQDIGNWDVSSGTNFGGMFRGAESFNQDIGNWDVSSGTRFRAMFHNAKSFDIDIGGWKVGKCASFKYMFYNAKSFNQDIGNWDMSSGTHFYNMFGKSGMTYYVGKWDMERVTHKNRLQIYIDMVGGLDSNIDGYEDRRDQFGNLFLLASC